MNKLIVVCLVGMIGLSSCNRQAGAILGKKRDKLEVVDPEFEYMSAKAKFRFDHEDKNVSATANFRIKKIASSGFPSQDLDLREPGFLSILRMFGSSIN